MSISAHPKLFDSENFEKEVERCNHDYEKASNNGQFLIQLSDDYKHKLMSFSKLFSDFSLIYYKEKPADTLAVYVWNILKEKYPTGDLSGLLKLSILNDNKETYFQSTPYLTYLEVVQVLEELNNLGVIENNIHDENVKALLYWMSEAKERKLGVIYSLT
jgi:hypothetical protein